MSLPVNNYEATRLDTATIVSDPTTRYFLIKSYNNDNIGRSLQHSVWATSQRNERVLGGAYQSAAYVVLVFSANHSSRFSGFGVMTSSPGESTCEGRHVFCGPDGTPFPGKMFGVHWVTNCEVFFRDCEYILNSFNENKPVKVGRDGQEIDASAGKQLCLLIDSHQPAHNRPAPLRLDGVTTAEQFNYSGDTEVSKHLVQNLDKGRIEDISEEISKTAGTAEDSVPNPLQQLAAVAKYLKHVPQPPNPDIMSHSGKITISSKEKPPEKISWTFNWLEKEVERNPILAVFPLDLTEIESYEKYKEIFAESENTWKKIEQKYTDTVPPMPSSLTVTQYEATHFDAELLLELLARSASQSSVNTFLSQFPFQSSSTLHSHSINYRTSPRDIQLDTNFTSLDNVPDQFLSPLLQDDLFTSNSGSYDNAARPLSRPHDEDYLSLESMVSYPLSRLPPNTDAFMVNTSQLSAPHNTSNLREKIPAKKNRLTVRQSRRQNYHDPATSDYSVNASYDENVELSERKNASEGTRKRPCDVSSRTQSNERRQKHRSVRERTNSNTSKCFSAGQTVEPSGNNRSYINQPKAAKLPIAWWKDVRGHRESDKKRHWYGKNHSDSLPDNPKYPGEPAYQEQNQDYTRNPIKDSRGFKKVHKVHPRRRSDAGEVHSDSVRPRKMRANDVLSSTMFNPAYKHRLTCFWCFKRGNYTMQSHTNQSGGREDEMKILVHVTIFETRTGGSNTAAAEPQMQSDDSNTTNLEAWITKGGTVAELRAVLESQDLLPETSDNFSVQIRLSATSRNLNDDETIAETTTEMHIFVRPCPELQVTGSREDSETTENLNTSTTRRQMIRNHPPPSSRYSTVRVSPTVHNNTRHSNTGLGNEIPALADVSPSLRQLTTALRQSTSQLNSGGRPFPSAQEQQNIHQNFPGTFNPLGGSGGSFQDEMVQALLSDPAMIRQVMSSPVMRSLMSSPDVLRSIMDSNPQMRELRERNPELNHLLNDPELLRQSMQAMQNPSLMREIISNTDRVINNINAIPGGFNALRRVYQSIQEPIWDVALGRGLQDASSSKPLKVYDLHTEKSPSTEAIPNPWAPRRPTPPVVMPTPQNMATPFGTTQSHIPTLTPRLMTSTLPELQHQAASSLSLPSALDVSSWTGVPRFPPSNATASSLPSPLNVSSVPGPMVESLSEQKVNDTKSSSDAIPHSTLASTKTTDGMVPHSLHSDSNINELSSSSSSSSPPHTSMNNNKNVSDLLKDGLNQLRSVAEPATVIEGQDSSPAVPSTTMAPDSFEENISSSTNNGVEMMMNSSTEPDTGLVRRNSQESFPFLYHSVFPNQHRLRSLGGLSLPNAPHITGVVRASSNGSDDKEDETIFKQTNQDETQPQ